MIEVPKRLVRIALLLCSLFAFSLILRIPARKSITELQTNSLDDVRDFEKYTNWLTYGNKFNPNIKGRLPSKATLRQQLSFQFPYEPARPFQKNIWQTWKVGKDSPDFPKQFQSYQETWESLHDEFKHNVLSDSECEVLVGSLYASVPDVVNAYNVMPKSILKADFFRYLILFARGGVYSDIDTRALKPISEWSSSLKFIGEEPNNAGLVVGIEADPDRPDWADWYARRIQFCQWTIQAKLGHPMLRELIARITEHTLERKKKGQLNKILTNNSGGDIMNWTGPAIFTDVVFDYLNNIHLTSDEARRKQQSPVIDWHTFTNMVDPKLMMDVLILPITSFSPGVNQMGAHGITHPLAFVQHRFSSTWKPDEEKMA